MIVEELFNPRFFTLCGPIRLRGYQVRVARAVAASVRLALGQSIVVMFPRQSGKNELQAQLEAMLLYALRDQPAELVKISPTWKPQSLNAMRRLEHVLRDNLLTRKLWIKESGYIYRIGSARMAFFSGLPEANIVGASATHLLEVDEAQDVTTAKFDKDIAPMAASTNATRVFWGTAWTSQTLLARELRAARAAELDLPPVESDLPPEDNGDQSQPEPQLAFVLDADQVAAEVPAYGDFVKGQVARLGRTHPSVRTQFYAEEIDGQAGMFPPERIARMFARPAMPGRVSTYGSSTAQGSSTAYGSPTAYAMLLDVAGQEEHAAGSASHSAGSDARRDATALTIVAVERATPDDSLLRAPTYRVIERRLWVGTPHADLYGTLRDLAARLPARKLVIDATGIGAGLAAFLERALPGRVLPFIFNAASKSRLGWDFLALIDSGRWQEPHFDPLLDTSEQARLQQVFLRQLALCQYEALPGPGLQLRWGVPDGTRDPLSGERVHDDLIISAALAGLLDDLDWRDLPGGAPGVVRARDPLDEMRGF